MPDGSPGPDMMHFALERLLATPEGWRPLMRDLVARWPEASPGEIIITLAQAATRIEAMFTPASPAREAARHAWRLAALLGADLYAMEAIGLPRTRADQLYTWWAVDPYFRDL